MTLPDVSPIVGERRLTQTSQAAISAQSRSSSTYASRTMPVIGQAEPLQPPVEIEAGRDGADEQQPRVRPLAAQPRERLEQLRDPLARVHVPERADQRRSLERRGRDRRVLPGGVRDPPDRALVARRTRAPLDVARVDDQPGREVEHLAGEVVVLRAALPERRDPLVEHAVPEQAADDAAFPLHRVEVAVAVAAADRQTRDEVVKDEVVQDDDAGPLAERLDDPAVCVRVVADVVERDIGAAGGPRPAALDDLDADPLAQRRQEMGAVVGDPRPFRRHRAVVGDLHESSVSMQVSQVTRAASARPAWP